MSQHHYQTYTIGWVTGKQAQLGLKLFVVDRVGLTLAPLVPEQLHHALMEQAFYLLVVVYQTIKTCSDQLIEL